MAMSRQMFLGPEDEGDIVLYINGQKHVVSDKYPATTSLNEYIRNVAGLRGTKTMCGEGGCGACAVTVTTTQAGDTAETFSINSCLCPLYSADGWQISTVEGIGSQRTGFHPLQETVAEHNGTQCGYCTPGIVMSMYGLLHQKPQITQQEIEDSLDGHICRCTGYRAILEAFKTFGSDSPCAKTVDIEDLNKHLCPKTGERCQGDCSSLPVDRGLTFGLRGAKWFRPTRLAELSSLMREHAGTATKIFFGNTGTGVFKNEGPKKVYIDLKSVKELYDVKVTSDAIVLGGGTTLTKMIDQLTNAQTKTGFAYGDKVAKHVKLVANVLVRNAGSVAGNLMMKYNHPEFPSDIFTMLEAVGAHVTVFDPNNSKRSEHTLEAFLKDVDMKNKVLLSVKLPAFDENETFTSFKITPRSQNAAAYVNAAFKVCTSDGKITKKPSIVYGGISAEMIHACQAEEFLCGKTIDSDVIQEALSIVWDEVNPTDDEPLDHSPVYRKNLAVNLLYKVLVGVCPDPDPRASVSPTQRPLSSALHTFQEQREEFPLKQPMPKMTAPLQASGEAIYTNDIPGFHRELFAALVLTTVASGTVKNVDPKDALAMPGVVRFLTASDIPEGGTNDYTSSTAFPVVPEEVFVTSKIGYAGQAIGAILAESPSIAKAAVQKVRVTYSDVTEPVLDLKEATENGSLHDGQPALKIAIGDTQEAFENSDHVITGEVRGGSQYYCFMETQVALAVPSEDGIELYAASQFLDHTHVKVAKFLNKPMNYFTTIGTRIGGGFGGKLFPPVLLADVACLGAHLTDRPVRLALSMSDCMKMFAPRHPILAKYKVGITKEGKMTAVDTDVYVDSGYEMYILFSEFPEFLDQGYHVPNWNVRTSLVKTDRPVSMPVRGPGSCPAALVIETIMEHAAKECNMHPVDFKELNLYEQGQSDILGVKLEQCPIRDMWKRLKQIAEVDARIKEVDAFNKANKWKKRGLTMSAVKYAISYFPGQVCHISVFAGDGTVTAFTTGSEMGQGLYTKVAQAVARTLDIPVDRVKVRPNNNNVTPNPGLTGGSATSEQCVMAAINACNTLKERIKPVQEKMPDAKWEEVLRACVGQNIELAEKAIGSKVQGRPYHTNCVGATETEVDVLTGQYHIRRVDMMCDFGHSLNPMIDIGQAEGAYVMGLGAYLLEDVYYDAKTGQVLNDGTWDYKPPVSKDIPIDWRIHFLPDTPNPTSILSSKAVGEPPIGLAAEALMAIKASIENAREEITGKREFLPVDAPYTVEKIQLSSGINARQVDEHLSFSTA